MLETILLFFIAFTGMFIGTLGGGGGFINIPGMLALGIPIHTAIGSNKFSNMLSSFSSFFTLFREGRITGKLLLFFIPFSLAGGIFGATFASSLSKESMERVAILLLSLAFLLTFRRQERKEMEIGALKLPFHLYPLQFGLSFYDGMLGPGQSTMQMLIYQRYQLSYLTSIALTRLNTFISCIGAFTTYYLAGHFSWSIALPLAVGGFIGSRLALAVARKISPRQAVYFLRSVTILLLVYLVSGQF